MSHRGERTGFVFFSLQDPSMMPSVTEAFFTALNAEMKLTPAMSLDDLNRGLQNMSNLNAAIRKLASGLNTIR